MDIQKILTEKVQELRDASFQTSPQITLGELISRLELIIEMNSDAEVVFDFGEMRPNGNFYSWRGAYEELAIGYEDFGKKLNIIEFTNKLKECIGKEFIGWKGGEFIMHEATPLWVANEGVASNSGVVGVTFDEPFVVIQTAWCYY